MGRAGWNAIGGFFLASVLSVPTWGANPAQPGTINYIEGQAAIGTRPIEPASIGTVALAEGQSLVTQKGKAEVLLTPGVFLRIGDNSAARMVSLSITNTQVNVEKGEATVEVAEIHPQNNLQIEEDGATTRLLKTGFYDFDANSGQVRVFDGKALVQAGERRVKVKGGREVNVNPGSVVRAQKFNKKADEGSLYAWSSLRSAYLAEANADTARYYAGGGWFAPGWCWNPWFGAYTFLPGDGIFYSPFGWGFYSPFWAYWAPPIYHGYYRHFDNGYHSWGPGAHYALGRRGHGAFFGSHGLGNANRPSVGMGRAPAFRGIGGGMRGGFGGMRGGMAGGMRGGMAGGMRGGFRGGGGHR